MTEHPLPLEWRERWLVLPKWGRLHRMDLIGWDDDDRIDGYGSTVCGLQGRLQMPGLFSRMVLPRCSRCCAWLGIPRGNGAPYNQGIDA